MIALACTKFRRLPSELQSLSYGELNFIFASIIHESDTIKKNIQLASRKNTEFNTTKPRPRIGH